MEGEDLLVLQLCEHLYLHGIGLFCDGFHFVLVGKFSLSLKVAWLSGWPSWGGVVSCRLIRSATKF